MTGRIGLLLAMACLAWAQCTTVRQHVVLPDGSPASGSVQIAMSASCQSATAYVGTAKSTVKFSGGNFAACLIPNDTCTAAGIPGAAWSSGTAYMPGAAAAYDGVSYIALVANTGVTPGTSAAVWATASTTYNVQWLPDRAKGWTEIWYVPTSSLELTVQQVKVRQANAVLALIGVGTPPTTLSWAGMTSAQWATMTSAQWAGMTQ